MPFQAAEHKLYDLLEGGSIKRYHMKQTIKEQPVANHSWRMAALIHIIWPDCRKELIMAALFHDVSERVTGDVASPIKWASPELAATLNRITTAEEYRLGIRFDLTDEERNVLGWADRAEGCLYCLDEIQMGNGKLHNTFVRYLRACSDAKYLQNVYTDRADHMKWLQGHLRERAVDLGVYIPPEESAGRATP